MERHEHAGGHPGRAGKKAMTKGKEKKKKKKEKKEKKEKKQDKKDKKEKKQAKKEKKEKKKEKEEKDETKNTLRREFSFTSFSRSFHLPENIEEDQVGAKYTDGMLQINIPKKANQPEASGRKINVD